MVAVTGRGVGDIPQVRVLSSGSSILWVTFSVTLVGGSGGAIHKVKTIKNGIPEAFLIITLSPLSIGDTGFRQSVGVIVGVDHIYSLPEKVD